MNRSLFRLTAYLQLGITILLATGCAPTQPFFLNESPDLQYYLNTATAIEYPDVEVDSLPETTEALPPLTIRNHDYQFWDLTLEECVNMALHNAKFLMTTNGLAEERANFAEQFIAGNADQFGSVYDIAIQQSTTQSIPLTVDGNGNRTLPRGVLRASQVGGVEDALAEFDAQASAFIDYQKGDRPNNTAGNIFNPTLAQSDVVTQQSALSKRFATGGVATLRQQILYSRNNTPTDNGGVGRAVPSDWTALIEAQIQHPLMRNRGTLINRIPVVLASLNEDISIAEYELQVRNLVRDVEVAYWDLYIAYRAFATAAIARNSAQVTADFAQLRLENDTGNITEVAQAKGQYYTFREQLQASLSGSNVPGQERFGVYGRERRLRALIGQSATDGRLIRPTQEPTIARVEHDWEEAKTQALYLNPELRQTKFRIKQSELELMSAKNQILPDVNLSMLYRWVGVGDTLGPPSRRDVNFPAVGSSALGELTEGNFHELGIRFEITPPAIGVRRELARIRGAQLRLTREQDNLEEKERLLTHLLSDAFGKLQTHYAQMTTNAQRWQAFETEVESRLAQFKNGIGDANVVLQSQQRRAEAQIAYYRSLGEYNKSINYVEYLKGTLLSSSNITLAEGPWHPKAYQDALERARERSAGRQLQYGVTRPGVVRKGPVMDADSAGRQVGATTGGSVGSNLPPGSIQGDTILEPAQGQPTPAVPGLESVPMDEVPQLDELSRPLSVELGESTGDVLGTPVDRMDSSVLESPVGSGISDETIPTPQGQPAETSSSVRQMTYEWQGGQAESTGQPAASASEQLQPVRRIPLPR